MGIGENTGYQDFLLFLTVFSKAIFLRVLKAKPYSSAGSVQDLRTGHWLDPVLGLLFFQIDDSYCDRIHSSLITVHCFNNGYVGKQLVTWRECCGKCWLKKKKAWIGALAAAI